MAETLGINPDEVAGKLFRVWCWFDSQSLDGHAGSVTGVTLFKFIDRLVALPGFAATMKSVGWLSDSGMPNFDYHNGESSKKRALNAKRQRKHRNVSVTLKALPEKRREDITPIVPAPKFEAFWETYPPARRIAKSKCLATWLLHGYEASGDQILLHVAAMKGTAQWQDQDGKFAPSTTTYLNQRRFEDGAPAAPARRLAI